MVSDFGHCVMLLTRLAILFVLLVISTGCTDSQSKTDGWDIGVTDSGTSPDLGTCDEIAAELSRRIAEFPVACDADADCTIEPYPICECRTVHRIVADPEFDQLSEAYGQCSVQECDDRPVCAWDGFGGGALLRAACIDSECRAVPQPDCGLLADRPQLVKPYQCTTDEECVVRTDTNLCGCPEAHQIINGEILARAYDLGCPTPEECALIDCVSASAARCEAGECVLVQDQ